MPSQIEARYGVPLPIDLLWRELEARYGAETVEELQGIYRQAMHRYSRAATLNKWRRLIAAIDSGQARYSIAADRLDRWRRALADPQAYIDETLEQ